MSSVYGKTGACVFVGRRTRSGARERADRRSAKASSRGTDLKFFCSCDLFVQHPPPSHHKPPSTTPDSSNPANASSLPPPPPPNAPRPQLPPARTRARVRPRPPSNRRASQSPQKSTTRRPPLLAPHPRRPRDSYILWCANPARRISEGVEGRPEEEKREKEKERGFGGRGRKRARVLGGVEGRGGRAGGRKKAKRRGRGALTGGARGG